MFLSSFVYTVFMFRLCDLFVFVSSCVCVSFVIGLSFVYESFVVCAIYLCSFPRLFPFRFHLLRLCDVCVCVCVCV